MESSGEATLTIKSVDGHEIQVTQGPLFMNKFFEDMLESFDEMPTEALELDNEYLTKDVLEKIMEYCKFAHKNKPPKITKPFK